MITPARWSYFITNASTLIGQAYSETPIISPKFSTTVPTDTEIFLDGWTGMLPQMTPWVGARSTFEHAPQTYSVTVIPFQATLLIDRFDLDDDKMGVS